MLKILGIDPGSRGGIAEIDRLGQIKNVWAISSSIEATIDILGTIDGDVICYIEQPFPRETNHRTLIAKQFANYGKLLGTIQTLRLPHHEVVPRTWQANLGVSRAPGEESTKPSALRICNEIWPGADLTPGRLRVPHDGIVDALLIAEYGRRMELEKDGGDIYAQCS